MIRARAEGLPEWAVGGGGSAARGAGWALAAGLLRGGGSLVAILALARLIGPEAFGVMGMVLPVMFLLGMFSDLGIGVWTLQRDRLEAEEMAAGFWLGLAGGVGAALLFAAAAPLLASAYGEPRVLAPALALAAWFPLQGLRHQHDALARRCLRQDLIARADLVETAAALAVGVALALSGVGLWALVGLVLARPAAHAAAIWHLTGWRPGLPRRLACRPMLRQSRRLLAADGALFAGRALDRVALGLSQGAAALGPYHVAHQLVTTPLQQLQTPLAGVSIPALTRRREDPAAFAQGLAQVGGALAHLLWPPMAVAAVSAGPLVRVVLGPAWAEAAPLVGLLALAALGMALRVVPGWALTALGRPGAALRWNLAATAVVAGAVLLGLPGGPVGVAAALAAAEIALLPLGLMWLRAEGVAQRPLLAALAGPLAVALIAAAALATLRTLLAPIPDAAVLALAGIVWTGAAAGSLLLLRPPLPALRPRLSLG